MVDCWGTCRERTKFNYRGVLNNELDSTGNMEQTVSAKKTEVVQGTGDSPKALLRIRCGLRHFLQSRLLGMHLSTDTEPDWTDW